MWGYSDDEMEASSKKKEVGSEEISGGVEEFGTGRENLRRSVFPQLRKPWVGVSESCFMISRSTFELEVGVRKVSLGKRTLIMGVLNVTPDSFSDGGLYLAPERAVQRGLQLVREGADWIDVGGESTRPRSHPVSTEEELRRVLPVIRGLRRKLGSIPIAIDSTKAEVAEEALGAGANIVNDVSGLRFDPRLAEVARRHRAPLILMHLRGRPETMQVKPFAQDIWRSLTHGFETSIRRAVAAGMRRSQIILDPGLGFGKSRRQNYEILASLEKLRRFRLPVLVGSSRKSFVQAIVAGEGLDPSRAGARGLARPRISRAMQRGVIFRRHLELAGGASLGLLTDSAPLAIGDAAAVVAAILGGAHIVRAHDPAVILPAVRVADALLSCA
jgi:dihydropteroate synthase